MGAARRRQQALGASYGAPPTWAWHYTMGRKIPRILAAGVLQDDSLAASGLPPDFYQVWFTTSTRVDPTSSAACTLRISYRGDLQAFKTMTGGHWRVGVACDHRLLITYQEALRRHSSATAVGRALRNLAHCGENRSQWRLAQAPVPIDSSRIEELVGGQWVHRPIQTLSRGQCAPGYGMPSVREVDLSLDAFHQINEARDRLLTLTPSN
jgi:hypothetical protein